MDWGMLNSLLLLSDGQQKLFVGTDAIFNRGVPRTRTICVP